MKFSFRVPSLTKHITARKRWRLPAELLFWALLIAGTIAALSVLR